MVGRYVVTSSVTTFLFSFMPMYTKLSSFSSTRVKFVIVNMVKSLSSAFSPAKLLDLLDLSSINTLKTMTGSLAMNYVNLICKKSDCTHRQHLHSHLDLALLAVGLD